MPLLHFLSQDPVFYKTYLQNAEWIIRFALLNIVKLLNFVKEVENARGGREKRQGSTEGDDPLSAIIANEETGKLWVEENTQA